jgi:hypothetical protein
VISEDLDNKGSVEEYSRLPFTTNLIACGGSHSEEAAIPIPVKYMLVCKIEHPWFESMPRANGLWLTRAAKRMPNACNQHLWQVPVTTPMPVARHQAQRLVRWAPEVRGNERSLQGPIPIQWPADSHVYSGVR